MRVLITTWNWASHYYPLVPVAWSLRAAGHEVVVATQPGLVPKVLESGLPAVAVGTDVDVPALLARYVERGERHGDPWPRWEQMRRFGVRNCWLNVENCRAMADGLWEFARRRRPDLVLFEATTYAGPLVAARLGVPAVRHTWGIDYAYLMREFEEEALEPFRRAWGLGPVESLGDLTVDPCPPSIQVPDGGHVPVPARRLPTRYVPYNGRGRLAPWLLRRPDRPRVCVSWGVSLGRYAPGQVLVEQVVRAVAGLDVEVVAAVSPADRHLLTDLPRNVDVRVNVPLHALLPTCDALVSQGGLGTVMTGLATGIPQLLVPQTTDRLLNAARLATTDAVRVLSPEDMTPQALREHVTALLTDPVHREAAGRLRSELDDLPDANAIAQELEKRYSP